MSDMETRRSIDKARRERLRKAIAARHARQGPARWAGNAVAAALIFFVQLYRWTLSPLKTAIFGVGAGCRFRPTCSAYAIECFRHLPLHRALYYATYRILRCNPWGGSGYDPVPGTIYLAGSFVPESDKVESLADLVEKEEAGGKAAR